MGMPIRSTWRYEMDRSDTFVRLAVLAACIGFSGCKEQLGPSGGFLACDSEGRCAVGYRCAQTEFGAVCLNEEQWQARCSGSEICNGFDDDCDGHIDEGLADVVTGTDAGECAVRTERCTGGVLTVVEEGTLPTSEICNGLDDDCDGAVDNDVPSQISGSSVGECERQVADCMDGTYVVVDAGVDPTPERCDGLDNDCDDMIDNGVADCCVPGTTRTCGIDRGACTVGTQTCSSDRAWGACSGVASTREVCDGLDNDCNGETDEGIAGCCGASGTTMPCSVNRGACVAGVQTCGTDGAWSACSGVLSSTDRCDGLDNDCDGETDEDFPDLGTPCDVGVGACAVSGERVCTVDHLGTTCGAIVGTPSEEDCNGVDDDCNGITDDPWALLLGSSCTVGLGTCGSAGTYRCAGDGSAVVCDATPGTPGTESCNGIDDDCDGQIDEATDVPPIRDGTDVGRCESRVIACLGGEMVEVYAGVRPTPESCNGLDDDCNGLVDDGILAADCYDGPPGTNGIGVCVGGSTVCVDGRIQCIGQVLPNDERCDGLDQDCDGLVDGSRDVVTGAPVALQDSCYTGPTSTLGVGPCVAGTTTCIDGAWGGCTAEVVPVPEACNDIDDDCDGTIDEPSIPGGTFNPDTNTWSWEDSFERRDLLPWTIRPDSTDDPLIVDTQAFIGTRSLRLLSAAGGSESTDVVQLHFEGCLGSATLDMRIYVASWDEAYADIFAPLFLFGAGGYFVFLDQSSGFFSRADGSTFGFAHSLPLHEWVSLRIVMDADAYVLFEAGEEIGRIGGGRAFGIEMGARQGLGGPGRTEILIDDVHVRASP